MRRYLFPFVLILSCLLPIAALASQFQSAPDIFVQQGHQKSVTSVMYSADGRYIVTSSEDRTVKLWDASTANEIRTFTGHQGEVSTISMSTDGTLLLSGDKQGIVKLWDVTTGRELNSINVGDTKIRSLVLSPDNRFFTCLGLDSHMKIWEIASGRVVRKVDNIFSYPESPDVTMIVTPDESFKQVVMDLSTGRIVGSLSDGYYQYHTFTPDGRIGLFSSCNYKTKICTADTFDIRTQAKLSSWQIVGDNPRFFLSPDGSRALVAYTNGLELWDIVKGTMIRRLTTSLTFKAVFAPDGRQAVSLGMYTPAVWDLASGKVVNSLGRRPISAFDSAWEVPGYNFAVIHQSVTNTPVPPAILDLASGTITRQFKGYIDAGAVTKDGKYLFLIGEDKKVVLCDLAAGQVAKKLEGDSYIFSPDGKYLLERIGTVLTVREFTTGREIMSHTAESKDISSMRFISDGSAIMYAVNDHIKMIDFPSGTVRLDLTISRTRGIAYTELTKDRRYLVSLCWETDAGQGNFIHIYDLAENREVARHNKAIYAAFFQLTPDNTKVLFARNRSGIINNRFVNDQPLELCELATGQIVQSFGGNGESQWEAMKFSDDGSTLITGDEIGRIEFWNVATGKRKALLVGHTNMISSFVLTSGDKRLISSSRDGSTRFWDLASGRETARLFRFTDGEWIVVTPEGYYNASPGGDKYLSVRVGNDVYGIGNYRETFFRPDLVKLSLSGASLEGYRTLADVKLPPRVAIVQTPAASSTESFTVTLQLQDQGGGIGDVRLFLNDSAVMMDGSRSLKAVNKGVKTVVRSYAIRLAPGMNTIRAVAFNADNSMQGNEIEHLVQGTFTTAHKPVLHALVIGINEYRNPKLKLHYAVADARLFAETLKKSTGGLFGSVSVKTLLTKETTTAASITAELRAMKNLLRPDDLFVLYVASHGVVDDGEYYLITSNVGLTRTEKLKSDALTQSMLKELISNISATKKLIVLDTCNAAAGGDAIQSAILTRGMSEDAAMKLLSRAVGSTILSAATSTQEALEGYKGHGLFTWVLTEGLKGKADKGKSGYVKTTDIADYVGEEVPNLAEKIFKRAQFPTVSMNGQPFPLTRVK
ncbi:MAG: caspase family protein [Geobacteraceae bacterium]|nr:caspase family protein [Geobacteraceae bacterium]